MALLFGTIAENYINSRKVILNESVQSKIKSFKITDPYIIRFLHMGGENLLQWNSVTDQKSIQTQIGLAVNKLEARLDPRDKKTIMVSPSIMDVKRDLEIARLAHPDQYPQLLALYKREGEDELAKRLAEAINTDKRKIMKRWLEGSKDDSKLSAFGSENNAARYILLKPVFDSTSKKDKSPPIPYNPVASVETLKMVAAEEDNKNIQRRTSIIKYYNGVLNKFASNSLRNIPAPSGKVWLVIPSESEDPKNYERNLDLLMSISSKSWCISGERMAKNYLSKGNFYMLVDSDSGGVSKGQVAVRMAGDNVEEIKGVLDGANQAFSTENSEDIMDLADKEDLKYEQTLKWINKMERKEGKPITPNKKIKPWRTKVEFKLSNILGVNNFMGSDPNQGLFDFAVQLKKDEKKISSKKVQDFLDHVGLSFSSVTSSFIVFSGGVEDAADFMDDTALESFIQNRESGMLTDGGDDFDEEHALEMLMSDREGEDELKYVLEQLIENDDITVEYAKELAEAGDITPEWFREISGEYQYLEFMDGDTIHERYREAIWATSEGFIRGYENAMYDIFNEHIQDEFILIDDSYEDEEVEIPVDDDVVFKLAEEYAETWDEEDEEYDFEFSNVDDWAELIDYNNINLDRAYYNSEYDRDAAEERYRNY